MAELQIDSMCIPQCAATWLGDEPAPPFAPVHVLVIDDETMMCAALSAMLKADGYQVVTAQSGKEAVERLRSRQFEVAITDLVMPEMDGIQTIVALKKLDPDMEVIVLTGHGGVESAIAAIKHGACDYLLKPITMPQLCAAVARALEKRRSNTSLSLYDAGPTLLAALETQEPILAVLKSAQSTMRATAVGLALVPRQGTGLHVEVSGSDGRLDEAAVKSLALHTMQARQSLRDPSFEAGDPYCGEAGIPAGSILTFPLEVRGALLGALVLWRENSVVPFTVLELRSGEILAAEIAIALDNAHLCRELSRKAEELETAHSAVARAEATARAIINAAQEAIILFDKEGVVWDLNPKALEMFGRSREETVGRNLVDFAIPTRQLGHFRENAETAYRVGRNPADKVVEVIGLRKNGEEFPLEILTTVIETPQGKLLSTFARDVTERRQAEKALRESEERYRLLFENNLAGVYRTTRDGRFLDCNSAFAHMLGYDSPQEVLAHRAVDLYYSENERAEFLEKLGIEKGLNNHELRLRRKDGSPLWVLASVNCSPQASSPCQVIEGTLVDITERKRAEAVMAERHRLTTLLAEVGVALTGAETLRQGLQRCAEILVRDIDAAFARVWTVNEKDNVLELQASAGMYTHLDGGHARVPIGKFKIGRIAESGEPHLTNTVLEDSWVGDPEWARREGMVAFAGYPLKVEERVLGVEAAFACQPMTTAVLQAFASVAHNIAQFIERKRAEQALREVGEKYRALVETTGTGYVIIDTEGRVIDANPEYVRLSGHAALDEILGCRVTEWTAPHDLARNAQAVRQCAERGFIRNLEVEYVCGDGKSTPIEVNATVVPAAGGVRILSLCRDITDRKRAEQALRESEERYRLLFENNLAGVFRTTVSGRPLDCNQAMAHMLGYDSPQDALVHRATDFYYSEDERTKFLEKLKFEGGLSNFEMRLRRKDGSPLWVIANVNSLTVEAGDEPAIQGILVDITERKRAEQALRESEERHRLLFERNLAGVFRATLLSRRLIDCNDAYARVLGYSSRQEVLNSGKLHDFYESAEFENARDRLFKEKALTNFEVRLCRKDHTLVWALANVSLIEGREGKEPLVEGTLFDITERKQAEQALAQERDLLRTLMDNLPDSIYFKDRESRFTRINQALATAFGLSDPTQAIGKTDFDFFTAEHAQQAYNDEQEVIATGKPITAKEEKETWPDGRVTWASTTKMPFRDAGGAIVGTFGVSREITRRMQMEERLREISDRLQLALKSAKAGTWSWNTVDGTLYWDDHVWPLFGLEPRTSPPNYADFLSAIHPHDRQAVEALVARSVQEGSAYYSEFRVIWPDGSTHFLANRGDVDQNAEGQVARMTGVSWDITEGKRAEEALRTSEQRYRQLFQRNLAGVFQGTLDGHILDCNDAYARILGYDSREEILRLEKLDYFYDPREGMAAATILQREGSQTNFEVRLKRRDGSPVSVLANVSLAQMGEGQPPLVEGTLIDISEWKRAEERTRLQTAALESAANGIVIAGREGRILWVNPAFTRLTGYSGEEVLDQTMRVLNSGQQDAHFYQNLWQTILAGGSWRGEIVNRRKDGTLYTDETTITPVRDAAGAITHFIAVKQDVTERKRAARALEERTTYLKTLIEISPMSIVVLDTEGCIQMSNPAFEKLFLYSRREMQGANLDELIIPGGLISEAEGFSKQCLLGASVHAISRRRRKDGTLADVEIYGVPLVMEGRPRGTLALYQDITERKRAEEALRASEERYRELFENASDLVFTTDLEARFTSLNRVTEQTLGYSREEAAEMNLQQLVDPKHWERIEQARRQLLAGESTVQIEVEILGKDGRRVMLEVKTRLIYKEGKPIGMQGIGRDITGREAAEMELRHAQKLESVGRLASGIAHEINTPIQFVGDNTRFLQESFAGLQTLINKYQELRDAAASGVVSPDLLGGVRQVEGESDCAYLMEEIPKALTQTLDGVSRVATIVRAMKDFAHPESGEKAAADLNKALLSTLTVARSELKYVADVETDFGDLPLVVCNISDLNQVFLNLLVNAAHAIAEVVKGTGEKGKIGVRTVAEGKAVLIAITDTGCGIPEGIRSKVFDPFFTTKEVGRGTGQGLAIARSVIVERHKGTLTFESEVGKGTTFYIRLPVESGEYSEETRVP
jgi:PAS domain S-box-containing protein